MTSIVIIFLIIAQCLSFYFIVLLNVKISRLKDVEEKQQRLKDDMDDAVGAYLAEMKDENDRLIAELKKAKAQPVTREAVAAEVPVEQPQQSVTVVRPKQAPSVETEADEEEVQQLEVQQLLKKDFTTPMAYAKNAYQKQRPTTPPLTMEEQAKQMYKQGHSIDEIAKTLNRGKTEIELLLKFQQ
jgi:pyruvate-formate lyase-activating enzyme